MQPAVAYSRRPLVLADLIPGASVRDVLLVMAGAAFTGLLAQVAIPVHGSPVPITGQTLGPLLGGTVLGWRRGGAALLLYLVAGIAGMPWFAAHTSGIGMPALGYIIGFVFAAAAVGALASRGGDRTAIRMVMTMVVGNAIIYAFGVAYLMADLHIGLGGAWSIGVRNYLAGDALKLILATMLLPGCWCLVRRFARLGDPGHSGRTP